MVLIVDKAPIAFNYNLPLPLPIDFAKNRVQVEVDH